MSGEEVGRALGHAREEGGIKGGEVFCRRAREEEWREPGGRAAGGEPGQDGFENGALLAGHFLHDVSSFWATER